MSATWPDSVERVAEYLRAAGAEARLEELESGTATAEDAARAAGCPIGFRPDGELSGTGGAAAQPAANRARGDGISVAPRAVWTSR